MGILRTQVELELNRILKSESFAGGKYPPAEKTGQLLRHIVEATLDGKSLTQNALLMDFYGFDPSELDASRDDARIGVLRLRKKLDNYNAGPGADDSVVITIPKGQYRAVFTENPSSPIQKEIRLGFRQLAAETMTHLYRALNHFERAIELQLANAEAWAGLASTYVATATDALAYDVNSRLFRAEMAAMDATIIDAKSWRAHAALGSAYLYLHKWQKADIAFETARKIAPLELIEDNNYYVYLLSRGHLTEARKLAQDYEDVGFDDPVLLTRAGHIFYLLRDFDKARQVLRHASELHPSFWRCHLFLTFVHLSACESKKAFEALETAKGYSDKSAWLGLQVMCLEACGKSKEAEKNLHDLLQLHQAHVAAPAQLALAYLALGDADKAISYLSESCENFDPFTACLHLWPILDPLRKYQAFRELLRKWDFPVV